MSRSPILPGPAGPTEPRTGDAVMAARLAPMLVAAVLGLVPFTVFSTFLVPIAGAVGAEAVGLGGLRGLGGLAALLVGVAYAPLVDRFAKARSCAVAMVLLAVGSLLLATGTYAGVIAFCLVVGAATAVLNPTLVGAASDRFGDEASAGRAATMVTSTTTLAAVLAGPGIGGLALLVGWRGVAYATAALALASAVGFWLRPGPVPATQRRPWFDTVGDVLARRDLVLLVAVSGLRTAAFMGALSVAAVLYGERHHLSAEAFTLVWTLSGIAFFCGNWYAGRHLADTDRPGTVLAIGVALSAGAVPCLFLGGSLALALVGTAALGVGHALLAAVVTTLLVRRSGPLRGGALGFNGVAQSAGTFLGASIAAVGHAYAGWPGTTATLGAVTLVAGLCGLGGVRGRGPAGSGALRS